MNITRSILCAIVVPLCSCGPSISTGAGTQEQAAAVEIPTEKPPSEAPTPEPDPAAPRESSDASLRSADAPPPPPGDSQRLAAAQATFHHARELMVQGKLFEACIKFEESVGLDPAVGSLLNLAVCEEQLGRNDRACRAFFEAASMAARNGQREREALARARMSNLGCPP